MANKRMLSLSVRKLRRDLLTERRLRQNQIKRITTLLLAYVTHRKQIVELTAKVQELTEQNAVLTQRLTAVHTAHDAEERRTSRYRMALTRH